MQLSLLVSAAAASVASGLFLSAGMALLKRRHDSAESERAVGLFAVWWVSLATYALAGANSDLLAALGITPFEIMLALRYMQMIAICIGLWGLMYYIAFVFTGKKSVLGPLTVFYAGYYALLLFLVTRGVPSAVDVGPWGTDLAYARPLVGAVGGALLLVIPPLVGIATYLALLAKAPSSAHKMRIALIALSTIAWSASIVLREGGWAAAVPVALGLFSGLSVSWAYRPPQWIRERVGEPA